jgi:hypothetical protein
MERRQQIQAFIYCMPGPGRPSGVIFWVMRYPPVPGTGIQNICQQQTNSKLTRCRQLKAPSRALHLDDSL